MLLNRVQFPFHSSEAEENFRPNEQEIFSTIKNRISLWFLSFPRDEVTRGDDSDRKTRLYVLSRDLNPNCGDWIFFRHRDKLSGALCSHFFTNAFLLYFRLHQHRIFFSALTFSPQQSNFQNFVRAPFKCLWSYKKNAARYKSVTHVLQIKISSAVNVLKNEEQRKVSMMRDDGRQNRSQAHIPLNHRTTQQIWTLIRRKEIFTNSLGHEKSENSRASVRRLKRWVFLSFPCHWKRKLYKLRRTRKLIVFPFP